MKIVNLKVSELKPYENNHRTHPQKQVDLLAKNIEKFGFTTPVLIDKNNVVVVKCNGEDVTNLWMKTAKKQQR